MRESYLVKHYCSLQHRRNYTLFGVKKLELARFCLLFLDVFAYEIRTSYVMKHKETKFLHFTVLEFTIFWQYSAYLLVYKKVIGEDSGQLTEVYTSPDCLYHPDSFVSVKLFLLNIYVQVSSQDILG